MSAQKESPQQLARPLIRLAHLNGVATSYIGQSGDYNEIDDEVIARVLEALGIQASTPAQVEASLRSTLSAHRTRLIAGTCLATLGKQSSVPINHRVGDMPSAHLKLEDGTQYSGRIVVGPGDGSAAFPMGDDFYVSSSLIIPDDVPMGYHQLTVVSGKQSAVSTLIVAPERVPLIEPLQHGQMWGWMAQIYSIRSHGSWGVGDYADLAQLSADAGTKTHADYMLVNPLHAAEPVAPLTPSPYLPASRRFINFTYIRPEAIPEYRTLDADARKKVDGLHESVEALNGKADQIHRDAMWGAKMPALWEIFRAPRSQERQAQFDAYKREQGSELDGYATWCLCYDVWGAPTDSPDSWIHRYAINSPEVQALARTRSDTLEFYRWLEWIADQQLSEAQNAARRAGMRIGIMLDMAVGVHPLGSDVWANPERFAHHVTVGAPPDNYNQQGQDWSQPPFNPNYLQAHGYDVYRELIRRMFQHAGALRIDHILGLFRLWWVPKGKTAKFGTYVYYNSQVMLGILAIEATRVHGVVVGEDLGVVPPNVAHDLRVHGLLGSVIEWFEKDSHGEFIDPHEYREMAITSVTTHDLPPTAGSLNYVQVDLREKLNLLTEPVEKFKESAVEEHNALIRFLTKGGWLSPEAAADQANHEQDIVEAMHKVIKDSPSKLLNAAVVDGVGERRTQNMPGTNNEYPNWRVPLADGQQHVVWAEDLFSLPRVQSLARIMNA
jgi:4-alpha-glucanotransferase